MRILDLLRDIDILAQNVSPDLEIADICYDSRKASKNSLFVAVRGFETDGHRYIGDALKNGCVAVLCEEKPEADCPYIQTFDTRYALAVASANFFGRPGDRLTVIGVTGTNGKTTVTTLIKDTLEICTGKKAGLIGTNRNMIGDEEIGTEYTTPESRDLQELLYKMAEAGCRYAVMEVSSHSLALSRVAGITFDVGVFTNLTQDHLDFHRNMDDYLSAKAKLFSMCKTGVFNLDDNASKRLIAAAACPVLTFAADEKDADVRAENINLRSDSVTFDAVSSGMTVPIYLGIPGIISVFNALAVIGCARALEIDPFRTANALKTLKGVKGRFETVPTPGCDFTILIDYAHSPDALENVLLTARGFAKGRVVIVFGCGGDRDKTKRPKMGKIASRLSDLAVVTTDNPRTENPEDIIRDILEGMAGSITPCQVIIDRREAIRWVIENAEKDDLIILAGKGHETYQIVGKTRYHMDEREIVSEILGGLAQG